MITYDANISETSPRIIQFENANEGRSYPFDDNVQLVSQDGKELPENVITDLHLVVPVGKDAFLSSVYITGNIVSACIKVMTSSTLFAALSVVVSRADFDPYTPYRLEKLTGSEDVGGVITFGNISFEDIRGTYRFQDCTIRITDSAVSRYQPAKLRKIIDDRTGESVSGDVALNFSSYIEAEKSDDGISLSLTSGAADTLATDCDKNRPVNSCGATPITSINGVSPDEQNRIVLWFH